MEMDMSKTRVDCPPDKHPEFRISLTWVELAIGLIFLIMGGYYMIEAMGLPKPRNPNAIGAGYFPVIVATGILTTVAMLLCFSLVKRLRKAKVDIVFIRRPFSVLAAMLILLGQVLLLESMGVIACTAAFSALLMVAAGERRLVYLVSIPLALTLGIYVVFSLALGVPFP